MIRGSHALRLCRCTSREAELSDLSTPSRSDQRLIPLAFYDHALALLSSKSSARQEAIQFPAPFDQANSCPATAALDLSASQIFENPCATTSARHTATTSGADAYGSLFGTHEAGTQSLDDEDHRGRRLRLCSRHSLVVSFLLADNYHSALHLPQHIPQHIDVRQRECHSLYCLFES
jgi:hypothetical protein